MPNDLTQYFDTQHTNCQNIHTTMRPHNNALVTGNIIDEWWSCDLEFIIKLGAVTIQIRNACEGNLEL